MTPDSSVIIDLVGNLGALGLVFWLVYRTHNHTIPRLATSFEEGLEKQRHDYREDQSIARADFTRAVSEQRKDFTDQLERDRSYHSEQSDKLAEAVKELAGEVHNAR